ncbi:MAG: DMT family transporter [Betaproteobacteria bacterium]|nr:DMT family transporter [Betaproteobacteria bacterium]
MSSSPAPARAWDALLAWYFVTVWGCGFLATKLGLQHAAPFTFLALRFAFGILCLSALVLVLRPRWPESRAEWGHVIVAGLLMHTVHLGGSHYAQYLGLSAGITAVLLSVQPLLTAIVAGRWLGEQLRPLQWAGVAIGLAGVTLIVWHKIDVDEATLGALVAVVISLAGVTVGSLYQRAWCPQTDLRAAALLQFVANFIVLLPLAWFVEGAVVRWSWSLAGAIVFLVIGASILAVNAFHTLMRRGQATRVSSLIYLTPIFAVALELPMFGVVPSLLSIAGIAVTCLGVAMVSWASRPPPP